MDEIAEAADVAPVGPDDLADVRYIHAAAFRLLARHQLSDEQVAAFSAHVYGQHYTRGLSEAIRSRSLLGARLGGELIGTAGWSAADGFGTTARIRWVYIRPLFTSLGFGRKLVTEVERRARRAGFQSFSAEAPLTAVEFFSHLGYEISSHGVRALPRAEGLPVAYLRKGVIEETSAVGTTDAWH
jgi:GNAT superfamily N-acetyltransferase